MKWISLSLLVALSSCAQQRAEESADPTSSFPDGRLVDLSYSYGSDTIYWPTAAGFAKTTDFEGHTDGGYYYSAYSVQTAEHGGTHLDAPIHFAEGRQTSDQIPLENLIGEAILIDVSEAASSNRDYLVSVSDIENWEANHGTIPDGAIVLLRTGFGSHWPDAEAYLGTAERGAEAVPLLHFPGLDPEAATWLIQNRSIHALGIDTASIDYGQSSGFETHRILLGENIPAFENVANMDQLPETGFHIVALPMKIEGGSGGPLRIIAIVSE